MGETSSTQGGDQKCVGYNDLFGNPEGKRSVILRK